MLNIDTKQFDEYRNHYSNASSNSAPVSHILSIWKDAKTDLYNLLGQNYIVSKPITINKPEPDFYKEMTNLLDDFYNLRRSFDTALREAFKRNNLDTSNIGSLAYLFDDAYSLISNATTFNYPAITIDGHPFKVECGEKVIRVIGKLIKILNLPIEEFEQFRQKHSLILNQKKLSGDLCLSIHPLDFATASDNDNGWSSCMSWQEEGCYRMGTIEMMNSPYVICAYLKSNKTEMTIADEPWPSKKWRAWLVVDRDIILCNRNYPYECCDLVKEALKFAAELAEQNWGISYLTSEIHTLDDWRNNLKINIDYDTNYMYNDVHAESGRNFYAIVNKDFIKNPSDFSLNYSGVAICINCGDTYDGSDADTLCCAKCCSQFYCEDCGRHLHEDEIYDSPDGDYLCSECFYANYFYCDRCGEATCIDDQHIIILPISKNLNTYHNTYRICNCCSDYFVLNSKLKTINGIVLNEEEELIDPNNSNISNVRDFLGHYTFNSLWNFYVEIYNKELAKNEDMCAE